MTQLSFYQKLAAILLFALAILFSFFHLTESPPFSHDEGWYVQVATNLAEQGIDGIQFSPGNIVHVSMLTTVGYPFTYTLALWFKLFGVGILQARILMAIFLLGFVVVSFVLARRLYGNNIALAALVVMAAFPPLYTYGKAVLGEGPAIFFLALSLLFFSFAETASLKRVFWFILAGTSAGLCIATKSSFIILAPVMAIAVLIKWRSKAISFKELSIAALSAIIPVLVWVFVQFQPGDTLSAILAFYANPAALQDVGAAFASNVHNLFTDTSLIYTITLFIIWLVSLVIRWRAKTSIHIAESIAFIFSALTIFSFLRTIGTYRYLLPAQALILIFFPFAFYHLIQALSSRATILKKSWSYWVCISLLGLLSLYQLSFHSYIADSYSSRSLENMEEYFASIPDSTSVFFYNAPHLVPLFHGRHYYERLVMYEKWVVGSEFLAVISKRDVDMLVLGPNRSKGDDGDALRDFVEVKSFGKFSIMERRTE